MHHSNIATLAAIVHSLKQHYINRGNGIYSHLNFCKAHLALLHGVRNAGEEIEGRRKKGKEGSRVSEELPPFSPAARIPWPTGQVRGIHSTGPRGHAFSTTFPVDPYKIASFFHRCYNNMRYYIASIVLFTKIVHD